MKKPRNDFSEDADSDIPEKFTPKTDSFDYTRREEMIPMRDGLKLKTIILVPKGVKNTPIVITRTPYNAAGRTLRFNSSNLSMVVPLMNDTTSAARAELLQPSSFNLMIFCRVFLSIMIQLTI